jgi:hypothetical protein
VTEVIQLLEAEFGKEAPTKMHGKVHDYLGMTLDFSLPGQAKILMINYIEDMLEDMPSDMDGEAATAAANHLFEVNTKDPVVLDEETATMFHHNVAKLLFLCKRARPDIQTAIAFLCTRVKGPDNDNYKKLVRVMRYLQGTAKMPLTLEGDNQMVGGHLLCSPSGHEKPHWRCHEPWQGCRLWNFNPAEAEYVELHRG